MSAPPRDRVFVSYSHLDAEYLDRLRLILAPDIRNDRIDYFDDREITPGDDWHARILESIDRARVAVLLVSPNFLRSKFIIDEELPRIFASSAAVRWVPLIGPFDGADDILRLQSSAATPTQPLASLPPETQDARLRDLSREIQKTITPAHIPNNLPFASLNDLFVGREHELKELDRTLASHGTAAVTQPHTVSGLGGIGKTRLAVEYAWACRDRFIAFLFVRAASPDELRSGLATLARRDVLDLVEQAAKEDEQYAAVLTWLQRNKDWLLILDNVDSPEGIKAVQELLPRISGGQVLITSRLTSWGGAIRQTRIEVLDANAARDLLIQRSGIVQGADEVARKLGYLPLALEQAAAYVKQQPRGFGFGGYLRLYEKHEAEMLAEPPAEASYPKSIYLTWRTTIDQLSDGARRILRMHAYLAPTPFPVSLYTRGAETIAPYADEFQARKWIAELLRYSMASEESDDAISMHGLVQAVVRHWTEQDGSAELAYSSIRILFGKHAPQPSPEQQSRQLWNGLLPHAEALRGHVILARQATEALLLSKAGLAYKERGDYRSAISCFEECLITFERTLGAEHPDALLAMNNLAVLYDNQWRHAEAESLSRRVLEAMERILGAEHPHTLSSMNNFAMLCQNLGRYTEAEPLHRRVLEARERVLGAEHPDSLVSVNNLAVCYTKQERYAEAEMLFRRALEARDRVLGAEHPDTVASVNNLAGLYDSQRRYGDAEMLFRRALQGFQRLLGQEHPHTLICANNLAGVYESQRRYGEAESLLQLTLEAGKRVLGAYDPTTFESAICLASLYTSQGRLREAEPLLRLAWECTQKIFGSEHPHTQTSAENHARCLAALNAPNPPHPQ